MISIKNCWYVCEHLFLFLSFFTVNDCFESNTNGIIIVTQEDEIFLLKNELGIGRYKQEVCISS